MLGVVALVSTHVDEDAHFPVNDHDGNLSATWAMHQMIVTKDFSTNSKLANFLYGGFTHHVAHHLFPGVGHTYYPYITPIIKRYAREYNLPYTSYPFYHAVRSHFRMLKSKGTKENIMMTSEV
jgi:linoleoyl-CoA desaturase